MEARKKYLKVLAFVPAIVLIGAFFGCRGGAFPRFSKPEPKPEMPSPVAPQPPANLPAAPSGTESKPPVFFNGTKAPNFPSLRSGLAPDGETSAAPTAQPNAPRP